MILVTVTLSDWIYRSVLARSVLTLHRDYFRLRKPLERRVYEIARKHCGRQAEWRIGLETLLKKSGSTSPRRVFRKMIRDMAAEDGLPDYRLELDAGDVVLVRARPRWAAGEGPRLGPEAHARGARRGAGLGPLLPRGGVAAALARRAAGRRCAAPRRPSSPSPAPAPPGRRCAERCPRAERSRARCRGPSATRSAI